METSGLLGAVPGVAFVFLALSVVFVALTVRDYLVEAGALSPARKTWLRVAFIFSAVTVGLFALHTFAG
jgi:hypothetical protein